MGWKGLEMAVYLKYFDTFLTVLIPKLLKTNLWLVRPLGSK